MRKQKKKNLVDMCYVENRFKNTQAHQHALCRYKLEKSI